MSPTLLANLRRIAAETRRLALDTNKAYPELAEPFRVTDYHRPAAQCWRAGGNIA